MPRTITISDQVWKAIAERGKFGETEDDVLRRVFGLVANDSKAGSSRGDTASPDMAKPRQRRSLATDRMSSYISDGKLCVGFASGPSNSWKLPPERDKNAIRLVRDTAVSFAKKHGATLGQVNAVKKALTDAGYYVTK